MNSHCLFCLVISLRFLVLYCCFEFLVTLSKDKKFQKKWHTSNILKFTSKWHEMRFKTAFDRSNISSVNSVSSASSERSLCGGATSISDGVFSNQNQNSWFWTCRPATFSCSRDVEQRGGGSWQCSGFSSILIKRNAFLIMIVTNFDRFTNWFLKHYPQFEY